MLLNPAASQLPDRERKDGEEKTSKFNMIFAFLQVGFLLYALLQASNKFYETPIDIFLFFLCGILSVWGQVLSLKRNLSINFLSFMFSFYFLSIAPLIQTGANHDPVYNMEYVVMQASLTALIFIVVGLFYTRKTKNIDRLVLTEKTAINGRYLALFATTLSVSLVTIYLFKDGLFTSRQGFGLFLGSLFSDRVTAMIVTTIMMHIPFFGALIGFRAALTSKKHLWIALFGFLLLLALVINNPFVNPRFKLAALLFFALDYFFRGQRIKLLAVFFLLGMLVAPLLSAFRYEYASTTNFAKQSKPFSDTFLSYDYDAFQLASYTILTVEKHGFAWGENLLGAVLFFVPRAIWPEKPETSNKTIYQVMWEHREVGTDNLSTPLMIEGYYAFGWIGCFFICMVYWAGVSKINRTASRDTESISFILRCVFAGYVLITLRGALTVGFSALSGALLSAIVPWLIFNPRTVSSSSRTFSSKKIDKL